MFAELYLTEELQHILLINIRLNQLYQHRQQSLLKERVYTLYTVINNLQNHYILIPRMFVH